MKLIINGFMGIILTACSAMQPTNSGFIDNYQQLQPVDTHQLRFIAPANRWPDSSQVSVAAISLSVPAAQPQLVDDWSSESKKLQQLMSESLSPFTGNGLNSPIELRLTVSDIDTSSALFNTITTLALFVPLDNGGITIEAQLVAVSNNQVLASWIWFEDRSALDLFASFSSYGHAELATQHFAQQVKQVLLQHQHKDVDNVKNEVLQ